MEQRLNHLGQPIGPELPGWAPPPRPARVTMAGRFCRLEPLDAAQHTDDLFAAFRADAEGRMWTYLAHGPYDDPAELRGWVGRSARSEDPLFYAIAGAQTGRAVGVASYLRISPEAGAIEVGHLAFAPALQRTPAATEAMFLMMQWAFDAGYRRYEWKCDALNAPSRAAARRLGFTYEGTFRQATIYKGRSRDTAWFAITDGEWPALRAAFARWLAPENFDAEGRQIARLEALRGEG